jgi:hypothetical protein
MSLKEGAFAVDKDMQQAAPAHFDALLAHQPRTVARGRQAVLHHEGRKRARRAAGRRIFHDPELRREHA